VEFNFCTLHYTFFQPATSSSTNKKENINITMAESQTARRYGVGIMKERVDVTLHEISFNCPKFPAYVEVMTRIRSFKDWPPNVKQNPRDLALAGFLYAGYSDHTRCFHCGIELSDWRPEDKPWVVHARWFPSCAFLRNMKGDRFIAVAQIQHPEEVSDDISRISFIDLGNLSGTYR
jgi:hypothetical protein